MSKIIYKSNLKNYKPVLWNGQLVYSDYSKIKNYLKQKIGDVYASVLAEPNISNSAIKGIGEANWSSEILGDNINLIQNFSSSEQDSIKENLQIKLKRITDFANSLYSSNNAEERKWGELITKAFQIPDDSCIVSDGENAVLVLWGFQYLNIEKGTLLSFPTATVETPPQNPYNKEPNIENTQNFSQNQNSESQYTQSNFTENNDTNNYNQNTNQNSQQETNNQNREENNQQNSESKNATQTKEKNKFNWKKFIWIPILLLVLVMSFFVFRNCKGTKTAIGDKSANLPDAPNKILPIDTTKIVKDSSGVRKIVGNRLNIALTGKNKNLNKFADAFKEVYPQADYKIVYYDTLSYRVQIEIPSTDLEKIKKELKSKMKDFEMLIFNEGLFEKQRIPSDPDFKDEKKSWYHKKIKATEAWDITQGDTSMVIAIIDGGFDLEHPELKGKIYKPMNIVKRNKDFSGSHSGIKHGTHVAGIALANADNGNGVSGIAPKCKLMPIQVADDRGIMSQTAVIDGILYAIHNGANIINLSLGMSVPNDIEKIAVESQKWIMNISFKDEQEFYEQLFDVAYKKNIIIILAGGNQNVIIGLDPMQRSKKTIKVSATDIDDNKAKFSNHGDLSTISAPGVKIYNSIPNGKFDYLDGTSMAAPVVAGGVAILRSINPALSFDELVDLMQSTGLTPNTTPDRKIGKILQLEAAAEAAGGKREKVPKVDCPNSQRQIDSLWQAIQRIKRECQEKNGGKAEDGKKDTLKIPKKGKDLRFSKGRWKSSSPLFNESKEKIDLYFDFLEDGTGKITLIEPDGTQCSGNIRISVDEGVFDINQAIEAVCRTSKKKYSPYNFQCKPDADGYAKCVAQNKTKTSNNFEFKLIKIR